MNDTTQPHELDFFTSPEHVCSYLDDKVATTMFADPHAQLDGEVYSWLSSHGFRRSGAHVYRPHCAACQQCVAVRVPINAFQARRRHRRNLSINTDIEVIRRPPEFQAEHYRLYEHYLSARHQDSQMEASTPEAYMSFLTAPWCDTWFHELRLDGQLVGVAVVDHLQQAYSSVYTFFSPDHPKRSLGRFAVLKQIEMARAAGLQWLYLGYWIKDCRKMSYKREYAPLEYFSNGRWWPEGDQR